MPVIGGDNLHSPSGIGLTDLPNIVEGLDSLNIKLYSNKKTYLNQAKLEVINFPNKIGDRMIGLQTSHGGSGMICLIGAGQQWRKIPSM